MKESNGMQLRKATRQKAKIRLGLSSVSGGGKTYSSLLIAKGLCGDYSKVAIIDTENSSADFYAHLGDFNVLPLQAPYTPERYMEAIRSCESAGMEVIIIDSITHEWDGKGGCLEIAENVTQASASKNSYTSWAKVTPRHQSFINAMLQSPAHIITTVRRKQDYEMTKDHNGKTRVEKAGLKEITREGWEYELTINLQLDAAHQATASKDRTELFMDKPEFIPTEETGKLIAAWCESGIEPIVTDKPFGTPLGYAERLIVPPEPLNHSDKEIEAMGFHKTTPTAQPQGGINPQIPALALNKALKRLKSGEIELLDKLVETYDLTEQQRADIDAAWDEGCKAEGRLNLEGVK